MRVFIQFENKPLLFNNPELIISCVDSKSVNECFQKIEWALAKGYYLAGFFSYELGYFFEHKLACNINHSFPLIYLGVYKQPLNNKIPQSFKSINHSFKNSKISISKEEYSKNIEFIRNNIELGQVYQVTYCIKLLFDFLGDSFSLYNCLLNKQPVSYPAFIQTDDFSILSLSPELFFKKSLNHIVTKPMKGTWPREKFFLKDLIARGKFKFDIKNRAENVMIADLLRNDLGRIGDKVKTKSLFDVTGYKTLFQMTSTIEARVEKNIPVYDLFKAIFPSGSVTGAPKIPAMEIIRAIEKEPRYIYTGAIGYITPERNMFFNVPIRTILLRGNSAQMGIGGGIIWDSTAQGEWEEGKLKAKFITEIINKLDFKVD